MILGSRGFFITPRRLLINHLGSLDQCGYNLRTDDLEITPGWGMPKSFLDAMNKAKGCQMSVHEELRILLDDTAYNMAQAVPNPEDWTKFVVYFLEELQDKTEDRESFNVMLKEVQIYISDRFGDCSNL